ncbi:MAG TPA: SMP-30/gluconolactonase/LRE family protein [Vicinamibacteria bacterium]|nr:SMP-30/gluconolactonase/LRE family protein [Vicinamibacteria bacterium]
MKRAFLLAVAAAAALLAFAIAWPMDPDPVRWTPPTGPPRSGRAAELPPGVERIDVGGAGPEDVAFGPDGAVYAGLEDGRIVRLRPGAAAETFAVTGGRPLGLRFAPDGRLMVADAARGLLAVDAAGAVTPLSHSHQGRPYRLTDDLDVARDGTVFFTDASDEHAVGDSVRAIVVHRDRGRLLAWRPGGTTRLVKDGLAFANGVALAPDEGFVLVAETASYRILRCWLAGPRHGTCDVFADGLPGFPDGVTRGAGGRFWVALFAPRNRLLDRLHPHPALKRVLLRLPAWLRPSARRHGRVLGLDGNGRVVHDFEDDSGQAFAFVTNAVEHQGGLYLGTLHGRAVVRIPLPNQP